MTDNVTPLKAAERPMDEDMVKCLEELLEQAKRGDIRTLIYYAFDYGKGWESGNVGETSNRHYIFGALLGTALDYYLRRREADTEEG